MSYFKFTAMHIKPGHVRSYHNFVFLSCRQDMKQNGTNDTNGRPNQILTVTMPTISDEAKALMPFPDTAKRLLRRVPAAHRPKDPRSLQDLNIIGDWTVISDDSPSRVLLYDNGQEVGEPVIIFAVDNQLKQLAQCVEWCMYRKFGGVIFRKATGRCSVLLRSLDVIQKLLSFTLRELLSWLSMLYLWGSSTPRIVSITWIRPSEVIFNIWDCNAGLNTCVSDMWSSTLPLGHRGALIFHRSSLNGTFRPDIMIPRLLKDSYRHQRQQ